MKTDHTNYPRQRPVDTLQTEGQQTAHNALKALACFVVAAVSAFAIYESYVTFCQ